VTEVNPSKEEVGFENPEPLEAVYSHSKNQLSEPWARNEERLDSYASERRVSDRYKLVKC